MDELSGSLPYEQSHDLHFENFGNDVVQQILENRNAGEIAASTPTITTLDALANNEFLQKIGATIINSIQLKHHKLNESPHNSSELNMDFDFASNHVVLDSSSVDQLQQQLEYDKFMNEVWIGIVFTLILISMVFCICSCFLYHQFRTWKRNYHNNANGGSTQCTIVDIEALKLHPDGEDPVPEYTLVSGLPSYEAALELLHKAPQSSCLIVYPSVFNVFNKHERGNMPATATATPTATPTAAAAATLTTATTTTSAATAANVGNVIVVRDAMTTTLPQIQTQSLCEATTPLLTTTTTSTTTTTPATTTAAATAATCNTPTCESIKPNLVPSYAEIFGYKTIDEKRKSTKAPTKGQGDKC